MSEKTVVLNVTYKTKPGMREALVKAIYERGTLAKVLAEDGCLQYEFFAAVDDPDRLFLVEEWSSRAAWKAHMAGAVMPEINAIKDEFALDLAFKCLEEA